MKQAISSFRRLFLCIDGVRWAAFSIGQLGRSAFGGADRPPSPRPHTVTPEGSGLGQFGVLSIPSWRLVGPERVSSQMS